MKIAIIPPKNKFIVNELLRAHYSERQLGAIYELLLDDRLGPKVMNMLLAYNLITTETEEVPSSIGWGYTELIFVINTIGETE